MFLQNRLSHALLFLGRDGCGGLALARAFVQLIVCEKANGKSSPAAESLFGETNDPGAEHAVTLTDSCGTCPSCIRAAGMMHPDIHYSFPAIISKNGDKKISSDYFKEFRSFNNENPYGSVFEWLQYIDAENKQGNISKAECDDITRKLSLKSFEGGYKFLIMWMPEYLGNEGNKLLKLIEEPPAKTIFILVAEKEQEILPTILSRTQLVKIPPVSEPDIAEALIQTKKQTRETALQIARACENNYRVALQLIHQSGEDRLLMLRDWMNSILKTGPAAQIKWIEEIAKTGREQQKYFLNYVIQILEDAVRMKAGISFSENQDAEEAVLTARKFAKMCHISQLEAIINELSMAIYYIERNANAKILFHALTIKLYHIISNNSLVLLS